MVHVRSLRPALALVISGQTVASLGSEDAQRLLQLQAQITDHDRRYFQEAESAITDAEYDRLKLACADLQRRFPDVGARHGLPPTPDDRTEGAVTARHRVPMLSLNKAHTEAELRAFHARLVRFLGTDAAACVVEPKYDGVAVSLTYENGRFVRAVTRGNGIEGEDISASVRALPGFAEDLRRETGSPGDVPEVVELRGEIFLPLAAFARINREREDAGLEPLAHPRNVAAGTLKLSDPELVGTRGLALVVHGWGAWRPESGRPASQTEFHQRVAGWGLPGVPQWVKARSADDVWRAVQDFAAQRGTWAMPTDGVVVKLDSATGQAAVGASRHAPRWAAAYKFPPEQAETRVLGIAFQVGRTGVLTPVAELEPVRLAGATVARATVHNLGEIERRDLRVGDVVVIERSGEVIPGIADIKTAARRPESVPFRGPDVCPACAARVVRESGGAVLRCPNQTCRAQVTRRLQHFASENGAAIRGLGPDAIDRLVTAGCVATIPDLFRLQAAEVFRADPGIPATTCARWIEAIARSREMELWRLLSGLGIPHIGVTAARVLAQGHPDLAAIVTAALRGGESGMRREWVDAIASYFADPGHRALPTELAALGVRAAGEPGRSTSGLGTEDKGTSARGPAVMSGASDPVPLDDARVWAVREIGWSRTAADDREPGRRRFW